MTETTWIIGSVAILATAILIGIIFIWIRLKERKSGFPITDERTQRINEKAAFYSLFMGLYFMIAYLFVTMIGREFFAMPEIEAGYPMIVSLLVFSVSYIAIRWYLNRKGEP
jgi:uncharacterized membrane protein